MENLYYTQTLEDIPHQFKKYKRKEEAHIENTQNTQNTDNVKNKPQMNDILFFMLLFILLKD